MFKRLLIAVFALGLALTLGGTAVADTGKGPLEEIQRMDPTNPRLNDLTDARPAQPQTKKPISAVGKVEPGSTLPGTPLEYFCDLQDYTSGSPYYYWTIPDAYGDDLFNVRFTSDAGFDCSLKVAHYLLYWASSVSGPKTYNSDMRCYLWADDGFGFPGAVLDSVDIPFSTIDAEHTSQGNLFFVSADFSAGNWVFSDGEEYHLGYTALNQVDGSIAIISDDGVSGPYAGEERASEYWGLWGSMLNDWGVDVVFFVWAERCCSEIPYSDCYTDAPIQSVNYFWRAPHIVYGDEAYSMRFDVGAQDTLVSVDVAIYNDGASPSSIDPAGNNTVFMTLYEDDGAGLPGAMLTQVALPPASYVFYPALQNVPFNYVLPGAGSYHMAFSSDGVPYVSYESCLSSNGTDGVGASASDWGGGTWVDFLSGWGIDVNFYFLINICKDEYSICNAVDAVDYFAYFWRLPDRYGDNGQAQKFLVEGVEECRLESVDLTLYWRRNENTATGWMKFQDNTDVVIYSDAAGAPGAMLGMTTVGPADYNIAESTPTVSSFGNLHVDLLPLDIYVTGPYWVAFETGPHVGYDTLRGIYTLTDDGLTGLTLGMAETWGDWTSNWGYMGPDWGLPNEVGLSVTMTTCCVPFSEHFCAPGGDDDWSTNQANVGRTGRSELSVGDSWCDLNVNWFFEHPSEGIAFTGPTVFGDIVIQGYNSQFRAFDLSTGAALYTITTPDLAWSSIRNSGTVEYIDALGTDVLFVGGGTAQGVYAYNVATGAFLWKLNPSNGGPVAGQTRWATFVVLNLGGTQYVFWGTDNGRIIGANAATGALMAGYPINLAYSTFKSTVSDGVGTLFTGTYSTAGEGDVYSIDAATATINWQLSGTDGLQATALWGADYTAGEHGFQSVSYADGTVFASGRAEGNYPVDGIMYSINGASGSINWYTQSNRVYYSSPIVDVNRVYMPSLTRWVSAPAGGSIPAFNRSTGAIDFVMQSTSAGRYYSDGFLTCEPAGAADQLFAFNEDGFLSCFNGDDGTEIWRRRVFHAPGYTPNIGCSGAIAPDATGAVHVLFADYWGTIYDFTKGDDRPRLQFYSYNLSAPVEFGAAPSLVVDLGPVLTNTGCLDLNISAVNVDTDPFTPDIPSFSYTNMDDNMMQRASVIANDLTSASTDKLAQRARGFEAGDNDVLSVRNTEKDLTNSAAAGFPTFINGVVTPYAGQVVAPGEDVNLTVDVIQSAILRGPQDFYVEVVSDDPDFFINNHALPPQFYVALVGGCLIDTATMEFGVGGANIQLVTNTGRLGTGDWSPHGFEIDGDGSSYYQGTYIYGVSTYRIASHTQDWTSGGGEADAHWSLQPDPNYCDNQCKPALTGGVSLGAMSTDGGVSYTPITGNMVCASYLDSVQAFWAGGWDAFGAPFDNDSTMGLYVQQRTLGALDVPELANLTLGIMEITERNGNAVDNWILGSVHDYDVGNDQGGYSAAASAGWSYGPSAAAAWGEIKIPFGICDGDPLINTIGLNGDIALWDWNLYWDSAYIYMSEYSGYTDLGMADGDGEVHLTLAAHNFAPNETYTVGIANFGITGLSGNNDADIAPLATLVNQWAGFGRGDVNGDAAINLADIIALAGAVNGGPGPFPFAHLGDVNCDGGLDMADVDVLIDYYFNCGACPCGDWVL